MVRARALLLLVAKPLSQKDAQRVYPKSIGQPPIRPRSTLLLSARRPITRIIQVG